jgi:hypothetical protein
MVFQQNVANELSGFFREIVSQLFIESREQFRIGLHGIERGEVQPLHRKAGDQAGRLGVGQHAPHLLVQGSGLFERTGLA